MNHFDLSQAVLKHTCNPEKIPRKVPEVPCLNVFICVNMLEHPSPQNSMKTKYTGTV